MKKAIVPVFILFLTFLCNYSNAVPGPLQDAPVTTLIINADVTVILVDNDNAMPQVVGRNVMTESVTVKQNADTLVISSSKRRNLKEAGVVYIPASQLRKIRINSGAHVKSLYALRIPKLDVIINGACNVAISNIGELNMIETEKYEFEYTKEMREVPASVLRKKE